MPNPGNRASWSGTPSRALKVKAYALAKRHLSGSKLRDAIDWLKAPHRSYNDISQFCDRLEAAEHMDDIKHGEVD